MDNIIEILKNNKKTIIICIGIILIVSLSMYLINKRNSNSTDYEYREEFIEKYEANQFVPVYIRESDMANKYLNDFKNLMINDIEKAYNVVNDNYKNKKYKSYDYFKESIENEYSLAFYSMEVKEYSVIKRGGYKFYYIRDNRNKLYIFKEISIMNYEVFLDDYTVKIK